MAHWIEGLIGTWGPVAVFLGCFFEGETSAVLGGMFAHRGLASWPVITLLAFAGAWLADLMWFVLARHAPDRGFLMRLRQKAEAAGLQQRLEHNRRLMTLLFRFLPGTRIAGPVLLGRTNMPFAEFALLNAGASALWAVTFSAIGWHFGLAAETLFGKLHGHLWVWLPVAVVLTATAIQIWRHRRH